MISWTVSCLLSLWIVEGHGTLPVRISPTVMDQEGENVCPSQMAVVAQLNETKEEIKRTINNNPRWNPCGGVGWSRIAYLDMRDPASACPTSRTLHTSPVRGCGRTSPSSFSCDSAIFSARGQSYSRVCGRILAYQKGTTDAFLNSLTSTHANIESAYVDGLSMTHGPVGSRQHIWTFAAAFNEDDRSTPMKNCPCTNTRYNWPYQTPSFIQNNYFCDTGNPGPGFANVYYSSDPLWDGAGCGENSTCCQLNNPPWFYSSLLQATTNDVEVRLCHGEAGSSNEDTIVYLIEIHVQL